MSDSAPSGRAFASEAEVLDLVREFEACTLPRARWDHRAHLTVALWYATRLGPDEALDTVRRNIHRLNAACGVESTPTSAYHETITRFYMRVVRHFGEQEPDGDWATRANRLFQRYGKRKLALRHYSEGRLMSPAARMGWVEPDLWPLP